MNKKTITILAVGALLYFLFNKSKAEQIEEEVDDNGGAQQPSDNSGNVLIADGVPNVSMDSSPPQVKGDFSETIEVIDY